MILLNALQMLSKFNKTYCNIINICYKLIINMYICVHMVHILQVYIKEGITMATASFKRDFVVDRKSEKCLNEVLDNKEKSVLIKEKIFRQATRDDVKRIFRK
jgi:hypothetical protein